jgi:hypothetical protein
MPPYHRHHTTHPPTHQVRDVLARKDLGVFSNDFTTPDPIDVHGVAMLRLSAV